jgi:GDPmannose 4,6-dehydratase
VQIDERYFRPTEVELLIGDPTKAKSKLGWEPSYDLAALVQEMVQADLKLFQRDAYLQAGGHAVPNAFE